MKQTITPEELNKKHYTYNQHTIDQPLIVSRLIFISSGCVSVGGRKFGEPLGFYTTTKLEEYMPEKPIKELLELQMVELLSNRIGLAGVPGYFRLPNAVKLFNAAKETRE